MLEQSHKHFSNYNHFDDNFYEAKFEFNFLNRKLEI